MKKVMLISIRSELKRKRERERVQEHSSWWPIVVKVDLRFSWGETTCGHEKQETDEMNRPGELVFQSV